MIAQVIPLRRMPSHLAWLDYGVKTEHAPLIKPGQLVRIPLQNHEAFGIVRSIQEKTSLNGKIKDLSQVVLERPFLSREQLNFLEEMAGLYGVPLGFLVKSNLPPLKKTKLLKINSNNFLNPPISSVAFRKPILHVYNNIEEKILFLNKNTTSGQTLILVPELNDIENIFSLIPKDKEAEVLIITSELTEKDLYEKWMQLWRQEKTIIVGTRRALFLPFTNLQNIILDDEANPNYKSWDMAPRFHTRDAVILLSQHHGAQLYFLTHTPAVETFYFAEKNIYYHNLNEVFVSKKNKNMPQVVDMANERRAKNYDILSDDVENALKNETGISFLYLNRRGTLHYISCKDCHLVLACGKCSSNYTYHEETQLLFCHHCGEKKSMQATCTRCGGVQKQSFGAGTQFLEKELKKKFGKNRNIVRLDSDDKKIEKYIPLGTIIIGTEYAWNKISWQKISLMVFVDADISLFVPEYKMVEQLWHKLHDVFFRLAKDSKLFIQTAHPEHFVFASLYNNTLFYKNELAARKLFNYPPYSYLVKFMYANRSEARTAESAANFYNTLIRLTKSTKNITITSPLKAFPYYNKGSYTEIILAKISYSVYKKFTKILVKNTPMGWKIDPNPNTILSL